MANIIFKTIRRTRRFNGSNVSFKERLEIIFIKDHATALKIRLLNSLLKLISCILYIVQVIIHDNRIKSEDSDNSSNDNSSSSTDDSQNSIIWINLVYFDYEPGIRYCQYVFAIYGLIELALYFYLYYNGKLISKLLKPYFIIEFVCGILWIFEMSIPVAHNLYIPTFLNCWIVKRNLEYVFKDYNNLYPRSYSVIGQHLIGLVVLFICLVMTSACGFEYLQRASSDHPQSLLNSFYHTIITFSTVGYGDITPDYWLSKLFVAMMIIVAIIIVPVKIEALVSLWLEKKKTGGTYTTQRSTNKHIVLCVNDLEHDFILHFLKEFYGHRRNQSTHTILFTASELNREVKQLLNSPAWIGKVYYIHGSALRDSDLDRAQVQEAKAVFIVTPRGFTDKDLEDQHTILRSWAIKDFAPTVPQFVQLFRTENKVHLEFVEHLVCEDEIKYAILANNCLCPGISTLITLLMHKAAQREKYNHLEDWQQLYGKLAGNEIHSICISKSKFFGQFIGKKFPIASYIAQKKYGVQLMAVATADRKFKKESIIFTDGELNSYRLKPYDEGFSFEKYTVILNPGYDYDLNEDDICIYSSITKEEFYKWSDVKDQSFEIDLHPDFLKDEFINGPKLSARDDRKKENATDICEETSANRVETLSMGQPNHDVSGDFSQNFDITNALLTIKKPPNPLFFGCFTTKCKLLRIPNDVCCLELNGYCQHRQGEQIQHNWQNKCIILAADAASNDLLNFIAPLRGKYRTTRRLKPIVLLLKVKPRIEFLESICSFPLVYWCQGSISNIDSLLRAGILNCSALVVVTSENQQELEDESLYDSSNIFAIENVYRFFPNVKIVSELRKASNIRFMKFRAKNMETEKYRKTTYMYKTPFTSGSVFSSSMLDTLLYQTYGRPYLIEFVRLLIGLKQIDGCGTLTAIPLSANDMWLGTYGHLFRKLAYTTGEIPIGIYRTIIKETGNNQQTDVNNECRQLVNEKMKKLKIDENKYEITKKSRHKTISYVLINPPHDYELASDDIIYIIQPARTGFILKTRPIIKFGISETMDDAV